MKLRWLQLPIFTIFGFLTVALNSRAETGLDVTSLVDITDVSKVAQDPMLLTAEISMGPKVTRIDFANSADGNCQQSIYTNSLPEIQPGKIARSLVNPQRCLLQNMKKEMDQATFSQNISCDPSRDQRIKKVKSEEKVNAEGKRTYIYWVREELQNCNCVETTIAYKDQSFLASFLSSPAGTVFDGTRAAYHVYLQRRLTRDQCLSFAPNEQVKTIIERVYKAHNL